MPPRKRKGKYAHLPRNLYQYTSGHFYYRDPATGQTHGFGTDATTAIAAANQLNGRLDRIVTQQDLVQTVLGQHDVPLSLVCKKFKQTEVPRRKLKIESEKNLIRRVNKIERDLSKQLLTIFTTKDASDYLESNFKGDSYRQHRSVLKQLFDFAVRQGLYPSDRPNPINPTMSSLKDTDKVRERLTKEWFDAIYEAGDYTLQIAMDAAIITLQRGGDLVAISHSDFKDGYLYVVQQKTEKWGESARLKIKVSPELDQVRKRSMASPIPSPLLIHRRPQKVFRDQTNHWSHINRKNLSLAFTKTRDRIGICDHLPKEKRPTFHEIRSLGGRLYEEAGYPKEHIQKLMGHTEQETTNIYLEDKDKWTEVEASLKR